MPDFNNFLLKVSPIEIRGYTSIFTVYKNALDIKYSVFEFRVKKLSPSVQLAGRIAPHFTRARLMIAKSLGFDRFCVSLALTFQG